MEWNVIKCNVLVDRNWNKQTIRYFLGHVFQQGMPAFLYDEKNMQNL